MLLTTSPSRGRSRLLLSLLLLALALVVFAAGRLALLLANPEDFAALDAGQIVWAFVHGLRFDLSISLALCGVPLLLLALPVDVAAQRWWRWSWGGLAFVPLAACLIVLVADVIYFGFVHRHVGNELLLFFHDAKIARSSLLEYWLPTVSGLSGVGLLAVGWWWLLHLQVAAVRRPLVQWGAWLLAAGLLVLGIRGSLVSKPIQVINAFAGGSAQAGNLTLNGPFVLLRTASAAQVEHDFLPADQARAIAAATSSDPVPQAEFPLAHLHQSRRILSGRPNVVVLMLESWGAHVGALRASRGLEPGGLTLHFDALAKEGVYFTNFYANGQRSMEGMAAILGGVPTVPGIPYIGEGLEQARLRYLGGIAGEHGWSTFFVQGSVRSSYRVDAIAPLAGFTRYCGAEDVPFAVSEPQRRSPIGADDDDTLQFALRQFDHLPQPFLGFVFTLSTHGPYSTPDPRWDVEAGDDQVTSYRNSLRYSDWAVGRFVAGIRAAPWGRDTLIVLVADHSWGRGSADVSPPGIHHVPLLLLHPELAARLDARTGSQVDLVPTLMDLCGWDGLYTGIGRSLYDPDDVGRGALCVGGDLTTWIDSEGWIQNQGSTEVASGGDPVGHQRRRHTLLGLQQAVTEALWKNRVLPFRMP